MTDYPSALPCPLIADYKGEIDFAFSSVTFNNGGKRRRRHASFRLEKYDLSFNYSTAQLWVFQAWANQFGYNWHYMPLVTHYSGFVDPQGPLPHRCRITSDINITALGADVFKVRVSVEIDPGTRPLGIVVPSGNWIIGGTATTPNNPDWIIGGTPTAPSIDIIAAGTPAIPAA